MRFTLDRAALRRSVCLSALVAALSLAALPGIAAAARITFRYQPVIGGVSRVSVAGSFNGWSADANPLNDEDKDGVWETTIELPKGRIEYKFVVNGDQWFIDENAADFKDDGLGAKNSLLDVGDKPLIAGHGTNIKKVEAPSSGLRKVTFKFKPEGKPNTLSLAGTFNDWAVGRTLLTDANGDGEYEATLLLAPGSYQYKFVVNDNGWTQDAKGEDANTDDGFGGKNSIKNVDDRFPKVEVKVGDGDVFPDGVAHGQGSSEVNHLGRGRVQFTARAHRGDIEGIDLVAWPGGKETVVPMKRVNADRVFEYYRAEAAMPDGDTGYAFLYRDGAKRFWLTQSGLGAGGPGTKFVFNASRFPAFETPEWVKHAVIYQIFPDRFRNGNPANDQDFKEWYYAGKTQLPPGGKLNTDFQEYYHLVKDWKNWQVLTQSPNTSDGRDWMAFYGGDLEGVRQGLDYLKDLGVSAIYFNPIFEAKSAHKYDCNDFRKIDPHFGTNEEFKAFVKEAKAKGIHVILDIVYNHSGNTHWAFKDAVEKGPSSPYYTWYEFKKWPLPAGWPVMTAPWKPSDYYYCWWGFGELPDFNFDLSRNNDAEKAIRDVKQAQPNIPLINYLLEATEYWVRDVGVDGLRLDAPNEVPYWFWELFNRRVKAANPDAYIVGELWGNASDFVKPGMYDAVMNYAFFRDPVNRFLGKGQGTAAEFDAALSGGRLAYPMQAVEAQMNLIDSHDTVRFLTDVGGNWKRLMLAVMFGMTYVGAPHIYYGDEIGMEGGRDPDCRRPFLWDWEQDPKRVELRDYYRKLTALRNANVALRTGEFRTVHAQGMVYGYVRSGGGAEFLVALNAGKSDMEMPLTLADWGGKVTATDMMTGVAETWSGEAKVKLAAEAGRVFRLEKKE